MLDTTLAWIAARYRVLGLGMNRSETS
jgi:hypothetical protein